MWSTLPRHLKLRGHRFLASDSRILASHERCRDVGIAPELLTVRNILSATDLSRLLHERRELVGHVREVFMDVHPLLHNRSTLLLLTDRHLRILEIYSAPEVICRCADLGVRPGASLVESDCGTNAVAMAIHHREPSIVKGTQHYCHMFHGWSCVAVPIIGDNGELFGCVDISLDAADDLGDTPALARLLADKVSDIMRSERSPILGASIQEPAVAVDARLRKPISTTQMSILTALRQGMTCKQIAAQLGMSTRTVESHLEKLRKKFNAKTTVHLIALIVEGQSPMPCTGGENLRCSRDE